MAAVSSSHKSFARGSLVDKEFARTMVERILALPPVPRYIATAVFGENFKLALDRKNARCRMIKWEKQTEKERKSKARIKRKWDSVYCLNSDKTEQSQKKVRFSF